MTTTKLEAFINAAQIVAEHWSSQDGINGAYLDALSNAFNELRVDGPIVVRERSVPTMYLSDARVGLLLAAMRDIPGLGGMFPPDIANDLALALAELLRRRQVTS